MLSLVGWNDVSRAVTVLGEAAGACSAREENGDRLETKVFFV